MLCVWGTTNNGVHSSFSRGKVVPSNDRETYRMHSKIDDEQRNDYERLMRSHSYSRLACLSQRVVVSSMM